ncbi:MAG: phage head-tail connector protein, partial [Turicibacter sanguinis]
MFELIKKLSNTQADDEVINFYIANAKQAIKSYLNDNKIDVAALYRNEVVELSCYYINKATMSQGSV